jgi:heme-degrading monooxygenase HmoA
VWDEKQAWKRFLHSSRHKTAAQTWRGDLYAGPI